MIELLARPLADRATELAGDGTADGPAVLHAFGVWGYAAVLARRRLAAAQVPHRYVLSSYTTYRDEALSQWRGEREGPVRRSRRAAEVAWIHAGVARRERAAYREADLVLVNYETVAALVRARFGDVPIARVPYATEQAFAAPSSAPPAPPLPAGDAPLVVSVARHQPRKGMGSLVDALVGLAGEGVPLRAYLMSEGPLLDRHRATVAEAGLSDRIVLPGRVEDVMPALRAADVFALPTRAEQSGSLAVLEALQAGAAIVATDVDGVAEDLTDGVDAWLVPPDDAAALRARLGALLADPAARSRLASTAAATYRARFAAEPFAAALDAVYRDVPPGAEDAPPEPSTPERTSLFDAPFYLATHADVAAAGGRPEEHWATHGAREHRRPHPLFDPAHYCAQLDPDEPAPDDPLAHFEAVGGARGLDPHPLFSTSFYLAQCDDDPAATANPLRHYLEVGAPAGLDPHPLFSTDFYAAQRRAVDDRP
jgi:glycosyltransferase involved in cell wall biosynthesis